MLVSPRKGKKKRTLRFGHGGEAALGFFPAVKEAERGDLRLERA